MFERLFDIMKPPEEVSPALAIPVKLVIRQSDFTALRKALIKEDGLERVAFLGIRASRKSDGSIRSLMVTKVIEVSDDEYEQQTRYFVAPKISALLRAFSVFMGGDCDGMIHVHSHPFAEEAHFSGIDRGTLSSACASFQDYVMARNTARERIFGMLVIAGPPGSFSGVVRESASSGPVSIRDLQVVGSDRLYMYQQVGVAGSSKPIVIPTEYLDRNIRWLGEEGQKQISCVHVAIVGLGGLGAMVALQLRGLGFKVITLIDGDTVELSNLNRLPGSGVKSVGMAKVKVMEAMIQEVSATVQTFAIGRYFTPDDTEIVDALIESDLIIGALDSHLPRFNLQILAARHLKPYLDLGSGIHPGADGVSVRVIGGQAVFYRPGEPCLCCQAVIPRHIPAEASNEVKRITGYVTGTTYTPASVVTINAIVAGIAVDQVIRYITGFSPVSPYVTVDLMQLNLHEFRFEKDPKCLICGSDGIEATGSVEEKVNERLPPEGWADAAG